MNFPDSPGKEQNVLTTGTEIWIGQGLVDKAECSPFIWTFFGYLRCTDSLSELESIGRSNLTWPALPATELGRTVLFFYFVVDLSDLGARLLKSKLFSYGIGGKTLK